MNHLKYALFNGESGILKCLDSLLRLIKIEGQSQIFAVDSSSKILELKIESEEYTIKHALYEKNWDLIKPILQKKPMGNSLISYLYKKNYAALALKLVDDKKARFSLAIDSGNLEIAYKTAIELKDKECYKKLAEEALRQGNHQLVEISYQFNKEYEKLSFLYLITG